jgi:hypothetical protein
LVNIFPWCTYGKYINYSVSGQIIGSHPWFYVCGTNGQWNCLRAICRRGDWCISEAKVGVPLPFGPYPVPSKITWGCVEALCITVRAVRPPPQKNEELLSAILSWDALPVEGFALLGNANLSNANQN